MRTSVVLFIIIFGFLFSACKGENSIYPSDADSAAFASATGRVLYPFGRYKLSAFENNANIIYNVDIEIKNEKDSKGHFIINGQSNANFYFAKFEADFVKQSVKIYGVGATKIGGTYNELLFEKEYLERLSKVVSYQFSVDGTKLILLLPEDDGKKIVFDVNKN